MSPELISAIAAAIAAATGWGMWWNKRKEVGIQGEEKDATKADGLFDNALELAQAQKDLTEQHKRAAEEANAALRSVTEKAHELEHTLFTMMADVDKWREVAVGVTTEFHEETGRFPLAWPSTEPHPAVA